MAERLTECIDSRLLDNGEMVKEYSLNSKIELNHFSCMDIPNAVYDKLGELEDILEKYGIGIQKLDYILEDYSKNQGRCFIVCEERDTLRQERDVWKRACELACDVLRNINYKIYNEDRIDFENIFYQQANDMQENVIKELIIKIKEESNEIN